MRTTSLALSPVPGATPGGQVCDEDGANARVGWGLSKLVLTLVACCVLFQIPAEAQVREIRRVLIINALGPSYPSTALIEEAIRTVLEKSPYQIEFYHEYLETVLFPDPSTQQKLGESYIQKYRDRKPDVIIADGLSSIRLMNASHEKFFPDTPTVFCGAIEQFANDLELDPQFAGVWMVLQPAKTLRVALQLLPGTKHVVVVSGTGKMDRLGEALVGIRQSLLNFIGPDLVAVRWKHWPVYLTDIYPTGTRRQRQPTLFVVSAPMAGYPKLFNIEMDPHEDLDVARLFAWVGAPSLKTVEEYKETLKKFPNPPVDKVKKF